MLVPAPAPLPVPNPTTSYWQSPPSRLQKFRSTTTLPDEVEYIIIGGGVSGSTLAYHLLRKKPGAQVLLLEARDACGGASGRNGGHCRPGNYVRFASDVTLHGLEDATKAARFEETNVRQVAAFVKEHNIDCFLEPVTTVDVYEKGTEELLANTLAAIAARKVAMAPQIAEGEADERNIHSASEAQEKFKTPNAIGAVSFPAYSINPYRFVCGVLEVALAQGLNLQTGTPVDKIDHDEQTHHWTVETSRGNVRASNVFLATNAYTSHLLPKVSKIIMPVRNQAIALRSGSKISEIPLLTNHSICFSYTTDQPGVWGRDYMVSKPPKPSQSPTVATTPTQSRTNTNTYPRDLVLGGGRHLAPHHEEFNTDDSSINSEVSSYLRQALQHSHFGPQNWGADSSETSLKEWTGIVGHTPDGNPYLGQMRMRQRNASRLWMCVGFTGHGMAMAFRSADAVSGLALGGQFAEDVNAWLPNRFRAERFEEGGLIQ